MPLSAFEDHFGTNACLKSLGQEEQGAARALLPEDLPPVVGTPGPGEGGG